MSVEFSSILEAASILDGVAHVTPVHTSTTLDDLSGSQVLLKCENFQKTGSFKFRGAYTALSRLKLPERERGVLTFSSGNHAQALALAGRLLGCPTTIVMPDDAPKVKLDATRGYGGQVVVYDRDETSREALGAKLSKERGLTIVPPYDHPDIVAGQGTVAKELFEQVGHLDFLFVPCGGGGLLSGCSLTAKSLYPTCQVIGVEPATADDATQSFVSKTLVKVHNPPTIADGARTPSLGELTFELVLRFVDDMLTVDDAELLEAMVFLWQRCKLMVEPTGALGLAGLLKKKPGGRCGVILSGGNADFPSLLNLL